MKKLISVVTVSAVVAIGAQAFRQNQSRFLLSTGEKNSLRDAPNSSSPGPFEDETLDPMALGQQTRKTLAETKYSTNCVPTMDEKENLKAYKQGKWSFFVETREQNGTSSQICLNDSQRIFIPGLLVEGGIREEIIDGSSFVVLDVVSIYDFIHPDWLKDGQVVKEVIAPNPRSFQRKLFYINSSQLRSDSIHNAIERNAGHYPVPDQLASVAEIDDMAGKIHALSVYIRESAKDSKIAVKAVDSALSYFGRGTPLYELNQKSANKEKIQSYILAEAEKYKGKDLTLSAHFIFLLYPGEEIRALTGAITRSFVEGVSAGWLFYCPRGGMHFETMAEHEAGTLHK